MITMYISNNRSSRNAKHFFNNYQIPVTQINISSKLTEDELMRILIKNPDEINSILSLRSENVKSLTQNFEQLRLSELIKILLKHPKWIKTPIIFDDKRFLVGFNSEDIRAFLPR